MNRLPERYVFTSMTRISDLEGRNFEILPLDKSQWEDGDYVLTRISGNTGGPLKLELTNGRMTEPMPGDIIVGALGSRYATLEATGSWHEVKEDGIMHLLTGAGLLGKMTSKSFLLPNLIETRYLGHIARQGIKVNMRNFIAEMAIEPLQIPVILLVGTSMSAGKTMTGRIVTRLLTNAGIQVVGGKLTGAGRYRDILALQDAGAVQVFDFVDVGLPSTILDDDRYLTLLRLLLTLIQKTSADIAVLEIGASPLEPYNGDVAIKAIREQIGFTILCASDPYAVLGIMESFELTPDLISGPATNTIAGRALIKNLCKVPAINLMDAGNERQLARLLAEKMHLNLPGSINS
jgi:hypothetical protein